MVDPTAEQLRNVAELINEFDKYWYVNGAEKEIRLKPFTIWRKIRNKLWKQRFPVYAFYHWAKQKWMLKEFNCFHFPINHDNMPIEGFPIKYELQGGWKIPKRELSFLSHGPLAAEGLHPILVPPYIGWQKIIYWFPKVAPVIGGAIGIVGAVFRYWSELTSLVNYMLSLFV